MQHIIWAFSRTAPESADEDSHFSVHYRFGSSVLNLTRTVDPVSEGGDADAPLPSPVPSVEAGDGDKVESDVGNTTRPTDAVSAIGGSGGGEFANFVHAGLCILAFLVVIPSGAIVVRYAKATGSSSAFSLHRNLQFGVGAFLCLWFVTSANYYFLNLYSWYVHCRWHARVPFHGQQWLWGFA